MNKDIVNEIINICNPNDPYFYADYFTDYNQKNNVIKSIFESDKLREVLCLKNFACLKVAYVSNSYSDFIILKNITVDIKKNKYVINFFSLDEEIDEMIFDIIIYDNLCFDDLKKEHINTENIPTPKIIFFDENCDVKI
jgi:hypothetical protein